MVSAKDLELAQVSVIGSLLLEPSLTGEVLLRLPDGDFLSDVCRTVYQAIRALFQAGETIDPVTVRQKLGGGTEWNTFLLQAMELTPTTAHVREYIRAVREEARLSRLRSLGLELAGAVDLEDARRILDKATGQLVELFQEKWGEGFHWLNQAEENAPHEANFLKLDCSKLKAAFGWRPRWHINEAIEQTVAWTRVWLAGGDISDEMDREIREYLEGNQ